MTQGEILKTINKRRRQILVHSTIYYEFNDNLISDATWSRWAVELENLQKRYPEIARRGIFAEAFENFDHSSGYNLPFRDGWAIAKAKQLLRHRDTHKE